MGLLDVNALIALAIISAFGGLFTFFMFIGTFRMNVALQVVFGTLTLLFALLAISDFTHNADIKRIAGYEGIFCGCSALYLAMAVVLNEVYGRSVLPIGAVKAG